MANTAMESDGKERIWKTEMRFPGFKKVRARGRRYVYIRGTNIALVSGFTGSDDELNEVLASEPIAKVVDAHTGRIKAAIEGWRTDAAKLLHKITSSRASHNGRSYGLSANVILDLLRAAGDCCQLTGIRFDYHPQKVTTWKSRPIAPSLDRISNEHGYEPDNIRIVCVCVNVAINEWGLANFERICRAFVARNGEHYQTATGDQRANLAKSIQKQMAELTALAPRSDKPQ